METWGSWFVVAGVLLNVLGTYLVGSVLVQDWREHRKGQPLMPWLARAWQWFRRVILRRSPQHATVAAALAGGMASLEGFALGYALPAEDAPVEVQIAALRKEVASIYTTIGAVRTDARQQVSKVREVMSSLHGEALTETRRVEEMVREVATGSVRRELFGLVLVGVGTIVGVVPSLPWW